MEIRKLVRRWLDSKQWYVDLLNALIMNGVVWGSVWFFSHEQSDNWTKAREFTDFLVALFFMFRYSSTRGVPKARERGYYIAMSCALVLLSELAYATFERRLN